MAYNYHIMTYTPLETGDGTALSVRMKTHLCHAQEDPTEECAESPNKPPTDGGAFRRHRDQRTGGYNCLLKKQYMLMKRAIMLGWALSVFALMLVSCASSPEATTTTTRQTTGTTPVHPPPSAGPGPDTGRGY